MGNPLEALGNIFRRKSPEAPKPTTYILQTGRPLYVEGGVMLVSSRIKDRPVSPKDPVQTLACDIKAWTAGDEISQQHPTVQEDISTGGRFAYGNREFVVLGFGHKTEDRNLHGTKSTVEIPHVEVSILPPSKK